MSLSCQQWDETMMRYFDHLSNDLEAAALEEHIHQCNRCEEQFNNLSEILGSLEQAEEVDPPEEFESNVMSMINAYAFRKREETRKCQMVLIIGILIILSIPLVIFGMMVSNLNSFRIIVDIGNRINNLSNLWTITSVLIPSLNRFLADLDVLLIKLILATIIIYLCLVSVTKSKILQVKLGLN